MRAICVLLVVFGCCQFVTAQLTPEEAYQKLQERKKERAAEDTAAATQPAATVDPVVRPSGLAVGRLLHQGWEALVARRYGDASTIFDKAIAIDATDSNALEGRGICKYELKQHKPADKDLQKAYELSNVGGPGRISRQMVIAASAASLADDNSMRAAKMLRGLMESMEQNGRLDEELQNDLGIALSHANAQTKKMPLFEESLKYYLEYDKKLNAQKKDDTARWGTQWIETATAQEKWNTYEQASTTASNAVVNADHATLARIHSYDHYLELHGLRLHSDAEIRQYMNEYKQSLLDEAAANRQMNVALGKLSKVEKPPFPDRIEHDWSEPR